MSSLPKMSSVLKLLLSILTLLVLSCCVKMAPLHYGTVLDGEHHLPLSQTEVFIEIDYTCFHPLYVAGPPSFRLPDRWAKTDEKGKFFFPPKLHMVPHSICWSTKEITYTRPGYFTVRDSELKSKIVMDLWTHSLNTRYADYKSDGRIYRDRRPMTAAELENLGFMKTGDKGVFYRKPGARFTEIYQHSKDISFFDDASGTWITLNHRAKTADAFFNPPETKIQNPSLSGSLFTDGEKIFVRHKYDLKPDHRINKAYGCQLVYSKGDIETISSHRGGISSILSTDGGMVVPGGGSFLTIEDEGRIICHYGRSFALKRFYNQDIPEKFCDVRFYRGYDASALPASNLEVMRQNPNVPLGFSNIDHTLDETRFVKLIRIDDWKYLVLTETPSYWHIYRMEWIRDPKTEKRTLVFMDLACLPSERKILDFTREGFISVKNEGLRKFDLKENRYIEDKTVYEKSHGAITSDLIQIQIVYAGYDRYVYAVSGEDKIYRFSLDGTPDYPIGLKPGFQQALAPPAGDSEKDKGKDVLYILSSASPVQTVITPRPKNSRPEFVPDKLKDRINISDNFKPISGAVTPGFKEDSPEDMPGKSPPVAETLSYTPSENDFITNTIGMKLVYIPPDPFVMTGPEKTVKQSVNDNRAARIENGFYLQTTEVTQWQWKAVMGNAPSRFSNCGWECPVENISWSDVQEFIDWLNRMENTDKYRLPTETEWEYACRAGTGTHFPFGDCLSSDQANFRPDMTSSLDCGKSEDRKRTIPVGSLLKNSWGLYDMHGNVAEWCQDMISRSSKRAVRGGSWISSPSSCRCDYRQGYADPGRKDSTIGFRLAKDP